MTILSWLKPLFPALILLWAASAAAGPKSKSPSVTPFQRQWLTPYFTNGITARAREKLRAGHPDQAIPLLRRHLKKRGAAHLHQARFLLAHALMKSKKTSDLKAAVVQFRSCIKQHALLADYCRYYGARVLFRLKQHAQADKWVGAIDGRSALYLDALLLRADVKRHLKKFEEGAELWRIYLRRYPRGKQVGKAHFRIAEALEHRRKRSKGKARRALAAQALEHYKQVLIRAPLWRREPLARKRLARLARGLSKGASTATLSSQQQFERGMVLYRAMRNTRSEKAFAAITKVKGIDPALACKATFYLGKSIFKQRQRARAVAHFQDAERRCREAGKKDLVVKSLYNTGRGLSRAKKFKAAIAKFAAIEREYPDHSYADDARLWTAEMHQILKQKKAEAESLRTIPEKYPDGDMAREALWRLARLHYLEGRFEQALAALERISEKMGRAKHYYAYGQALYWQARIWEKKKKSTRSAALYERCIREYPLSYYALMAFNRLRERHARRFRKLYDELIAPIGKNSGQWRFSARPLFRRAGFLRGVELARLGFGDQAAREFARVGLSTKRGQKREDLWLAAVLYDRAKIWQLAHQVPRSRETSYKWSYPLGENFRRWAISYPRAFHPLVPDSAKRAGVHWTLVQSIMREESGFSTTIESYANAMGLMQLILSTARAAGNQHKLTVTRRRLQDPAVNIKLGATYLGFLYKVFGALPLTISGYNAGEGATHRWIKRFGKIPLDEFLERIPYDQTRNYTKRVLSTLLTYSVLYRKGKARIPRITQKIPKVNMQKLLRKKKKKKKKARKPVSP